MCLPFLPADTIVNMFTLISSMVPNDPENKLIKLLNYVNSKWIDSRMWPPSAWSVFGQSVRTNNDVAGWHRRLNGLINQPSVSPYELINILHEEAKLTDIQVHLVTEQLLRRYQRNKYAKYA